MLKIKDVHCTVDGKEILHGLSLEIKPGEVHAVMGPNGTGKSTLSHLLAGRDGYELTSGEILFEKNNLTALSTYERARKGIFLAFQHPLEIPGVSGMNFMKSAVNAVRKARGQEELDGVEFLKAVRQKAKTLNIDDVMLKRSVNQGFSGGEKKRFEILQMMMLEPKFIILDEPDSGLDVDALEIVATAINESRNPDNAFLVITHYQRLLNYVTPDVVHILNDGRIVASGGPELAEKIEKEGYKAFGIDESEEAA
jgi:Fe-S cluster assembly ATP-binding protein